MRRNLLFPVIGLGLILLGGTAVWYRLNDTETAFKPSTAQNRNAPSLIEPEVLSTLPSVDRSTIDTSHLDEGMTPPTNTWFSGAVLRGSAEPTFPYPNSFRPTATGFELGLPKIQASAETISGPHAADIAVTISDARSYKLERYDELTIRLGYYSTDGARIATVTQAAGNPYVFLQAHQGASITYTGSGVERDGAVAIERGGTLYGMKTDGRRSGSSIDMPVGSTASFFSSPDKKTFPEVARYSMNVITEGSVEYRKQGADWVTTLNYKTTNDKPTLIARLPHQRGTDQPSTDVSYPSILGTLPTTAAASLRYRVPHVDVRESLPVRSLAADQKNQLVEQLDKDVTASGQDRNDTYFGGKQLQRTAQLLLLADQLGAEKQRERLKDRLNRRLGEWLSADGMFQYDTRAQALVGKRTSFGADTEVNDHHFHYGYVIYAAAVLARYDASFKANYADRVSLLVADIANYKSSEQLPLRRNYDAYFGHSWASGTAPFRDGNNQESTSEAMNAWAAIGLWAERTDNPALAEQAEWMLSNEISTAQEYWLKKPTIAGYAAPIASIVWGGKREYKTFFSDDANPKLSILLLPLNPSMRGYAASLPSSTFTNTDTTRPYGDYILMAKPDATIEQARKLPDASIDDGNSRTYLYAYVMTRP